MCNLDHYQTPTYLVGLDPGIALSYALFRRNYSDALPLGVILSDPRELTLCFILLLLHIPPAILFFQTSFIILMMIMLAQIITLDFFHLPGLHDLWERAIHNKHDGYFTGLGKSKSNSKKSSVWTTVCFLSTYPSPWFLSYCVQQPV